MIIFPLICYGEIVELEVRPDVIARADYRPVDNNKPLLIVLHGFLQTYEFQATKNIIDGLMSNGYPVLGPNLSLGVNKRKKSLECEAVHTHTLKQDLQEIKKWIAWGKAKGHTRFVLVGHSWGSHHILALLEQEKNIHGLVGTMLVSLTPIDEKNFNKQIRFAKKKQQHKAKLAKYHLGFCKEYTSIPASFLSYAQWTNRRSLNSLKRLRQRKIFTSIILGKKDRRLTNNWVRQLRSTRHTLHSIKGANHFFSSVYEFDLLDRLSLDLLDMKR